MPKTIIKRTQTGVRIETSLLKVLEGIVLHSFEAQPPFSPEACKVIDRLKSIYGCNLTAKDSHQLKEGT